MILGRCDLCSPQEILRGSLPGQLRHYVSGAFGKKLLGNALPVLPCFQFASTNSTLYHYHTRLQLHTYLKLSPRPYNSYPMSPYEADIVANSPVENGWDGFRLDLSTKCKDQGVYKVSQLVETSGTDNQNNLW